MKYESAKLADEALARLVPLLESYGQKGATCDGLHAVVRSLCDIRSVPFDFSPSAANADNA